MCIGDRILPPKLFAGNSAFALATIKERMPVILVRTLDDLNKNITKYGNPENNFEDAKLVIHRLSKLRYELVTNKPFATLFPEPACSDIDQWNSEIARLEEGQNTAFSAPWLFTECYMYRRIMNIVSQSLPSFDPFTERKLEGFKNSRRLIASMIACLDQTLANTEEGQPADRLKFYLAGDLHYRKLLEDRSWAASSEDPKFVFGRCFPSAFDCCRGSSPLILVLRVAKSDVAVGVSEHRHSKLVKEDPDWWTKGKYGFAQIVSLA
uniref:Sugar phosphate phosphatase n=2 Tax=Schistocephalus solidus TaxID=70667 RepID=A0A0X3PPI2_SCHSO